jgi:hypothetical protein
VLFAVLPPKNGDSTGAEVFSAQRFAIALIASRTTMPANRMAKVKTATGYQWLRSQFESQTLAHRQQDAWQSIVGVPRPEKQWAGTVLGSNHLASISSK